MQKNIVWQPIRGYENLYEVSNEGNVRNRKMKIIKSSVNKAGYKDFSLYLNGQRKHHSLHRLLAIAFIKNPEGKLCINHIDGNKFNNDISNLEWVTHSENNIHALVNNLTFRHKGTAVIGHKLKESEILHIRETKGLISNRKIAKFYSVGSSTIAHIRIYNRWKHLP